MKKEDIIDGLRDLIIIIKELYPDHEAFISILDKIQKAYEQIGNGKIPFVTITFGLIAWWIKFKDVSLIESLKTIFFPKREKDVIIIKEDISKQENKKIENKK